MGKFVQMQTTEERFWTHVTKGDGDECWRWTASTTKRRGGYGRMKVDGKLICAHRYAWELANGPVPDGLRVLHRCDNPICVRASHLFLGTQLDNIRDRDEKCRTARGFTSGAITHPEKMYHARGEKHPVAKLTDDKVAEIRMLFAVGNITKAELARRFHVGEYCIFAVVTRATWRHVA